MKVDRKVSHYQACYQCGFENLNTATHCLACKVKLKPLLPYKQAFVESLRSSKFSSRTPWAIVAVSTETEIITQPFKNIPRLQQISPIEGCVIIYSHPLTSCNFDRSKCILRLEEY